MSSSMEYIGLITAINPASCCFTLDNDLRVYYVLLRGIKGVPVLNSSVKILYRHRMNECVVLCPPSTFYCTVTNDIQITDFIELANEYKFGVNDIFLIDKCFQFFDECDNNLIKEICRLIGCNTNQNIDLCIRPVTKLFKFSTITGLTLPDSEVYEYLFHYWIFGVNRSEQKEKVLYGLLQFDTNHLGLVLCDIKSDQKTKCVFTNQTNLKLESFLNRYVVIRKYLIIMEHFKWNHHYGCYCLLFDLCDVTVMMSSKPETESLWICNDESCDNNDLVMDFKVVTKSSPILINGNAVSFCIQTELDNKLSFLVFDSNYIPLYPLIQVGHTYHLEVKEPLRRIINNDLRYLDKSLTQFLLKNNNAHALSPRNPTDNETPTDIFTIDEAKQMLPTLINNKLITFRAKIFGKKFADSNGSRTNRKINNEMIGTIGPKTHVLIFKLQNGSTVDLYLNNFEIIKGPLCLIPEMVVICSNVTGGRNYFKSTLFTAFQVVSYEPATNFQTILIRGSGNNETWGPRYFLSLNKIPLGTVLWNSVSNVTILGLKIAPQNKFHITFIGKDQFGPFKVTGSDSIARQCISILLFSKENGDEFESLYKYFIVNRQDYSYQYNPMNRAPIKCRMIEAINLKVDMINKLGCNIAVVVKKMNSDTHAENLFCLLRTRLNRGVTI